MTEVLTAIVCSFPAFENLLGRVFGFPLHIEIGGRSAGNSLKSSLCGAHAYRISELATSQPSYTQFHALVPGHAYGPWCFHIFNYVKRSKFTDTTSLQTQ